MLSFNLVVVVVVVVVFTNNRGCGEKALSLSSEQRSRFSRLSLQVAAQRQIAARALTSVKSFWKIWLCPLLLLLLAFPCLASRG